MTEMRTCGEVSCRDLGYLVGAPAKEIAGVIDDNSIHDEPNVPYSPVVRPCCVVSCNIQAGKALERRRYLAYQFHERGAMIVGIQESRSPQDDPVRCGMYLCASSQCSPCGSHGRELWLHQDIIQSVGP